ncbi:hypothetical protein J6590_088223 [Homalodisca vitripennis]|nr:hypothetical protein J6590_088223 [Homalodisca vitripennis]
MQTQSALKIGQLVGCYDLCTRRYFDRTVGNTADVADNVETHQYGYLQKYRTVYRDVNVTRVFLFCDNRFRLSDEDALMHLQKDKIVFIPLIDPGVNKRGLVPPGVANKIYVRVYSQLLYLFWYHLSAFVDSNDTTKAVVVSFQKVEELSHIESALATTCHQLVDANRKPIFLPIKQILLKDLEKYGVASRDSR